MRRLRNVEHRRTLGHSGVDETKAGKIEKSLVALLDLGIKDGIKDGVHCRIKVRQDEDVHVHRS